MATIASHHAGTNNSFSCCAPIGRGVNSCLSRPHLRQPVISKDSSITHQSKRGWFIYLVNTCALLITPHITLKEFHLHQSHDCSIENDFFPSFLLFSRQDGIKSWLSFNSFNVAFAPRCRFKLIKFLPGRRCIGWMTGNIIKRDLPRVVILLTARESGLAGELRDEGGTVCNFPCSRYTCQGASRQNFIC